MRRWPALLLLFLAATLVSRGSAQIVTPQDPLVILISFDGWRSDYDSKASTPNLRALSARGVQAEYLIPSFPTKTFPNHYSIVTGLYPGHHGIIGNYIHDPATGRSFAPSRIAEVRDPMWWGGEPIWVTAERAGLRTGAMFWVGTEAPIGGVLPRYWRPYDETVPPAARVDQVLAWLDLPPAERPSFIALYFSDADDAGHDYGPDSPQVRDAVQRLDQQLGRLLDGLQQRNLVNRANIVVLSDHGMAGVTTERVIVLDDYVSADDVDVVDINPLLSIVPKPGREDAVYRALLTAHPRLHVYRRDTMPARWQYRDHPRVPAIFAVADEGWQVMRRSTLLDIQSGKATAPGGQHGYDAASATSMRALFVAAGPAFRQSVRVPPFENVHVYNALAAALRIAPAPNDGDPAVARQLLR